MYFKMVPLLFPLQEAQGDFSLVFTVRTCSSPRDKFHNITKAPLTGSPWSFNSQTCPHWASLQQFLIYSLGFSTQALVPTRVSIPINWKISVFPYLSNFGGSALTYVLPTLMAVDFFFRSVWLFTCLLKWWFPSALHIEQDLESIDLSLSRVWVCGSGV